MRGERQQLVIKSQNFLFFFHPPSEQCVFTVYFRVYKRCIHIQCQQAHLHVWCGLWNSPLYLFFSLSCTDCLSNKCFLSHMMFCSFSSRMPLVKENTARGIKNTTFKPIVNFCLKQGWLTYGPWTKNRHARVFNLAHVMNFENKKIT